MMFYTVYKITNVLNDKIYIGKHMTNNTNDDYMGSGLLVQRAIAKYGSENFKKEILFMFDNEQEMNDKERELVTEEFVKEDTSYNLCVGGNGGWNPILAKVAFLGKNHSDETKSKISAANKGKSPWNKGKKIGPMSLEERKKRSRTLSGKPKSDEYKKNHSKIMKEYYAANPSTKGWPKGKLRPKVSCPYCDKEGSVNNMYRWHFKNCRNYGSNP